jgi:hypothetical protein
MTNQQAKLLLQGYRPNGEDANDPLYAEALEQVRRDPELARWFESEQSLDAALTAKLRELPVPPDLKASILALGIPSRRTSRRWLREPWLAAAAAVALLLGLGVVWLRMLAAPEFAAYRDDVIQRVQTDPEHLAFDSRNLAEIRQWLRERGVDANLDLSAGLAALTPHGCRLLDWHGQKVALICLVPKGGPHVDLLVIDRTLYAI